MKKLLFLMLCIGLSGSALAQLHETKSQSDDEYEETVEDVASGPKNQSTEERGLRRESSPRSGEKKSSQRVDEENKDSAKSEPATVKKSSSSTGTEFGKVSDEKNDSPKGDAKRGSARDEYTRYTAPTGSSTEFKKPGSLAASLVRIIKRKTGSFAEGVYNGVLFGGAGSLLLYKLKEGAVSSFSTILGFFASGVWWQRYRDVQEKEEFAFSGQVAEYKEVLASGKKKEKSGFSLLQKIGDIVRVSDNKIPLREDDNLSVRYSLLGGSTSYRLGFVTGFAGTAYLASKAAAKVAAKATAKVAEKAIQAAN